MKDSSPDFALSKHAVSLLANLEESREIVPLYREYIYITKCKIITPSFGLDPTIVHTKLILPVSHLSLNCLIINSVPGRQDRYLKIWRKSENVLCRVYEYSTYIQHLLTRAYSS
jgi:hypothetical protein